MTEDALVPVEEPEPAEEVLPTIDHGPAFAMLRQLRAFRVQQKWLETQISLLSQSLAEQLEKGALFTDAEGHEIEAVVVRPDGKVHADLARLRTSAFGDYELVTKSVLDTVKLRRALQAGTLSGAGLACLGITPRAPYMRLNDLTQPEEETDPDA